MRKTLSGFYLACGSFAALSMLGIAVIITAQILARFFAINIPSSDDISGYLVAGATFMGLAYAMDKGDHIRVDLFINQASERVRRVLDPLVRLGGFILMAGFFCYVFLTVKESYDYGDLTQGQIAMPLWLIQLPYVIGVFALTVSVLDQFFRAFPSKHKD